MTPGAPREDLRLFPCFAHLPDDGIRSLRAALRIERFSRGTILIGPDRRAGALSLVCSGQLRATAAARGGASEALAPGDWFGADAVLLGPLEPRTVEVAEDAEVAMISRSCIDALLRGALSVALGVPSGTLPLVTVGPETGPGPARASATGLSDGVPRTRARIGLALSGGGAKAFAHLGVLQVLHEAGIEIDLLAGTSAGAIAAAMHCAGKPMRDMLAFADQLRRQVLRRDGMWDFLEPPTVGLIRGERTRALYDQVLDGATFARLRKPLAIPAADLLTGEAVVLRDGSVADAIRASAGVPGLYAPFSHSGRYLMDGSLVNPLPVDLLRNQGADLVIASQVIGSTAEIRAVPPPVQSPHYLDVITARANAILDLHAGDEFPAADVLIRPELDDYDVLDYPMAEELIALGEAAARVQLPEIRSLTATWSSGPAVAGSTSTRRLHHG